MNPMRWASIWEKSAQVWLTGAAWGLLTSLLLFALVALIGRLRWNQRPLIGPEVRCWLWWSVCAKLALTFLCPLFLPASAAVILPLLPAQAPARTDFLGRQAFPATGSDLSATRDAIVSAASVADDEAGKSLPVETPPRQGALPFAGGFLLIWLMGVGVGLVRATREIREQRHLLAGGRSLDDTSLGGELRLLGSRMGLTVPPRLWVAESVSAPLVLGRRTPRIALPPWYDDLSPEELRMALAHELAHVRRGDLWWGLAPFLAQLVGWPLRFLTGPACRAWEAAREADCDRRALQVTGNSPAAYGHLLLRVLSRDEQSGRGREIWAATMGATASFHTLRERIELLRQPTTALDRPQKALALVCAGLILPLLTLPLRLSPSVAEAASFSENSALATAVPLPAAPGAEDVKDVVTFDIRAGGDKDQRYLMVGAPKQGSTAPRDGYRLLLVLPGGDGSDAFNPFLRRIRQRALGENYLLAELVAPRWDARQKNEVVWPTSTNPWPGMRFTTEAFARAVLRDVSARYPIDPHSVFALGWASGGPPVYALSLDREGNTPAPVTGYFVAMSVFNRDGLPPLERAKGQTYFLLHPTAAPIVPLAKAQEAATALRESGAKVELAAYEGGYGWRGDVFAQIRRGIQYLETHQKPSGL